MNSAFPKVQIVPEEETKALELAREKAYLSDLALLTRVTYLGHADPKTVSKNRAKNKVARKQRRINRLRSK